MEFQILFLKNKFFQLYSMLSHITLLKEQHKTTYTNKMEHKYEKLSY